MLTLVNRVTMKYQVTIALALLVWNLMTLQDRAQRTIVQTVRTPLQLTSNERFWCQLNSDKGECVDIDECMDVDFICDPNAMCVNDIMDVAKVNYFGILVLICPIIISNSHLF